MQCSHCDKTILSHQQVVSEDDKIMHISCWWEIVQEEYWRAENK